MNFDRSSVLPTISIGLTQQNLEFGEQFLMDVSDPSSENYGKHWSPKEVVETFAPSDETILTVKSWLMDAGITEDRMQLSLGRSWLRMNLTIAEAENLLKTEYRVFEHKETSKRALAVEEYSVPQHVQQHIDYITPTLESTTITKTKPRQVQESGQLRVWELKQAPKIQGPKPGAPVLQLPRGDNYTYGNNSASALSRRDAPGVSSMSWDLSICGEYVTRACIQYLYNLPNNTHTTYGFPLGSNLEIY
jgi:tripeptidyl-peptidase-1